MGSAFRSGQGVLLSLCLALGAMPLSACKEKSDGGKHEVEAAKASAGQLHEELKGQVAKVQKAVADIHARLKALPEDLSGLEALRSKVSTVEEVQGVEEARVNWLSGELSTAGASGSKEQLQKVSELIAGAIKGSKGMEKSVAELGERLVPAERRAARLQALSAAGTLFTRALPTGTNLKGAKDGVEQQLIEFVENKKQKVDKKTWFVLDQVSFAGASAQLDVEQSKDQLENLAAILKAYPRVQLEVGGPADSAKTDAAKLSLARAGAVKEQVGTLGVADFRLLAAGHGPAHPACPADDTDECKAKNQRLLVRVAAK